MPVFKHTKKLGIPQRFILYETINDDIESSVHLYEFFTFRNNSEWMSIGCAIMISLKINDKFAFFELKRLIMQNSLRIKLDEARSTITLSKVTATNRL